MSISPEDPRAPKGPQVRHIGTWCLILLLAAALGFYRWEVGAWNPFGERVYKRVYLKIQEPDLGKEPFTMIYEDATLNAHDGVIEVRGYSMAGEPLERVSFLNQTYPLHSVIDITKDEE